MKKNTFLVLALVILTNLIHAQKADSIPDPHVKWVFPGITLGTNYTSYWNPEASFILALANRSKKQTKLMTVLLHGPTLGCQLSRYNGAHRIAPKFSYEVYSNFFGGRVGAVDYLDGNTHSFYVTPEVGISFGSFMNFFFGVNLPVGENKIAEVRPFRFSATVDLFFFYFGKDKSK